MFNREIQVRTVRVPKDGETEHGPSIPDPSFEEKVDVIVNAGRKLMGTAILGVVTYVAVDAARKFLIKNIEVSIKSPTPKPKKP